MKSFRKKIPFCTEHKVEFINISSIVQDIVAESTIQEGLCLINSMQLTASVFISDDDTNDSLTDYQNWLEEITTHSSVEHFIHRRTGEENGPAQQKTRLMGRDIIIGITEGHLDMAQWEEIYFGDFDGQREKNVLVKIIGE